MKFSKKIILIIVAVVLVLGISVGLFFFFMNKDDGKSSDTKENMKRILTKLVGVDLIKDKKLGDTICDLIMKSEHEKLRKELIKWDKSGEKKDFPQTKWLKFLYALGGEPFKPLADDLSEMVKAKKV
ncbi:hypothetical protein SLOPH_1162 [Spraguea lophii 42_110]|uniref:Uncharacterized protein n=1 Tax=Spraguea lophii (strain 42_110) TaxID=1358809 RepID=S7W6I8_SPRLO|nr:hypothetical protein SLOPH_1162 [Spraguea lophii 42_110]